VRLRLRRQVLVLFGPLLKARSKRLRVLTARDQLVEYDAHFAPSSRPPLLGLSTVPLATHGIADQAESE
jgi:hypothetical protein